MHSPPFGGPKQAETRRGLFRKETKAHVTESSGMLTDLRISRPSFLAERNGGTGWGRVPQPRARSNNPRSRGAKHSLMDGWAESVDFHSATQLEHKSQDPADAITLWTGCAARIGVVTLPRFFKADRLEGDDQFAQETRNLITMRLLRKETGSKNAPL